MLLAEIHGFGVSVRFGEIVIHPFRLWFFSFTFGGRSRSGGGGSTCGGSCAGKGGGGGRGGGGGGRRGRVFYTTESAPKGIRPR